jgi:ABC-type transport system involved in multi-copper enzyme maturation permease subunit
MNKNPILGSIRIVLAIAGKDISEALKSRTLVAIAIGVLVLMMTGPALSLLTSRSQPILVLLAPAGAGIFDSLEKRQDMRLVVVDSEAEMESVILQPMQTILGVVVPDDLADSPADEITLQGFTAHWVSSSSLRKRAVFFETTLSSALGETVHINIENARLYPSQTDGNQFSMTSISLLTMIMLVGIALVPLLFIEEKENHTIDALLVSPARFWQIVVGKLIAGGVYCLVAASIVLLFNYRMVVHWELMLGTVLLGTCFTVAFGLLLGMIFDNAASMGLWTSLLTILLLFSPLVQVVGSEKIPPTINMVLSWLPSSAMYQMISQAMIGEVNPAPIWQGALLLAGTSLVLSLIVIWRIRQSDKQP